jgi:hypothetical protein
VARFGLNGEPIKRNSNIPAACGRKSLVEWICYS